VVKLRIGQSKIIDAWIPVRPTTILLTAPDADLELWEDAMSSKSGFTRHFTDASDAWRVFRNVGGNVELVVIDQPGDTLAAENLYRWCKKNAIPVIWCDVVRHAWLTDSDFVSKPFDHDAMAQKLLTYKRGVIGKRVFK
jgi:hypothetical protein